jgi:hypothetical protein
MKNFHSFQEFIIASLFSISAFFAPTAGILLVVLGFVFLDTLTAYFRVKKDKANGKKIKWTSRSFIKGFVPKMIGYVVLTLLFFLLDKFLLNEFVMFIIKIEFLSTKLIALGLVYAELKSIDETWKKLFGKGIIKYIIDMINFGNFIKNKLKDINQDKEDDGKDN